MKDELEQNLVVNKEEKFKKFIKQSKILNNVF